MSLKRVVWSAVVLASCASAQEQAAERMMQQYGLSQPVAMRLAQRNRYENQALLNRCAEIFARRFRDSIGYEDPSKDRESAEFKDCIQLKAIKDTSKALGCGDLHNLLSASDPYSLGVHAEQVYNSYLGENLESLLKKRCEQEAAAAQRAEEHREKQEALMQVWKSTRNGGDLTAMTEFLRANDPATFEGYGDAFAAWNLLVRQRVNEAFDSNEIETVKQLLSTYPEYGERLDAEKRLADFEAAEAAAKEREERKVALLADIMAALEEDHLGLKGEDLEAQVEVATDLLKIAHEEFSADLSQNDDVLELGCRLAAAGKIPIYPWAVNGASVTNVSPEWPCSAPLTDVIYTRLAGEYLKSMSVDDFWSTSGVQEKAAEVEATEKKLTDIGAKRAAAQVSKVRRKLQVLVQKMVAEEARKERAMKEEEARKQREEERTRKTLARLCRTSKPKACELACSQRYQPAEVDRSCIRYANKFLSGAASDDEIRRTSLYHECAMAMVQNKDNCIRCCLGRGPNAYVCDEIGEQPCH